MSKRKSEFLIMLFAIHYVCLSGALASEPATNKPVDKDITSTKHWHFPFVHVDVARHKDGTKDVDVRAPFTKVHNPAGADNADVKAPFYKAEYTKDSKVNVKAPVTNAKKSADKQRQKQN